MTGRSEGLTSTQVAALFGPPVVRAQLDWAKLLSADVHVYAEHILELKTIAELYTTWYISADGSHEVPHHEVSCRSLRVDQAVEARHRLQPDRAQRIEALGAATSDAAVHAILCYELPQRRLLLLDGNHRMCGLIVAGIRPRVLATILRGPVDPVILPDLGHWAEGDPASDSS